MALQGRIFAISIPDTILEDKDSLRDKTAKLGLIARACSIYGVDLIEVFRDRTGRGEEQLVRKVLGYLETPQYLRKRLYPLDDELRYAGMLPPLRIPSHKGKAPPGTVPLGEVREGVVNKDGTVDIGLDVEPRLEGRGVPGQRVTVEVTSERPPVARIIPKARLKSYWGYQVESKSLEEVLSDAGHMLRVATSKRGTPLVEVEGRLKAALKSAGGVRLIFGPPSKGLYEIVGPDLPQRVDFVVNLFPVQHVETVRTEEAISAGLGLLALFTVGKA